MLILFLQQQRGQPKCTQYVWMQTACLGHPRNETLCQDQVYEIEYKALASTIGEITCTAYILREIHVYLYFGNTFFRSQRIE